MLDCVVYEQPLNERTRNFLRLEHLFRASAEFIDTSTEIAVRSAIGQLLDIDELFSRSDVQSDLLKELERLAVIFTEYEDNPDIDQQLLGHTLNRVDDCIDGLHQNFVATSNPIDSVPLLSSLKRRQQVPGGCIGLNLPEFQYWLERDKKNQFRDLHEWFDYYRKVTEAVSLILELFRTSARTERQIACSGVYSQSLATIPNCQLLRVGLDADADIYPEISAGKHHFTVRMMQYSATARALQTTGDISFRLQCCSI